jgi:hypothetical protein
VRGIAQGRSVILVLLGASLMTASCSNDHPAASRSSVTSVDPNSNTPAPSLPPPTVPSASDCQSGSVAVAVSLVGAPLGICLRTGATMTVIFTKSEKGTGPVGPWTVPPVRLDGPILTVISTSPRGSTLTAVLRADTPGVTTVYADFDQECSAGESAPCTIPPLGMVELEVRVVAS